MAAGVEPAALQELHQAAKEELAHFRAERDSRSRITGTVTNALRQAWESGARRRPGLDVGHASAEAAPQRPGPASAQHNSERSDAAGRSGHGPRAPSESPDAAKKNGVTAPQPAEQSAAQDLAARRTAPNEAQLRQSETPDADRLRSLVADSFSRFAEHLSHVPPANVGEVAGEILRQMAEGTRNAMALARSIEPPPTPKAQAAGIAPRTAPTPTPKPIAGSTPKQAPVEPPRQASLALSPPPQSSQSERRSARLTARVMSGPAAPQVRKAPDGPAAEATRQVPTADGPQTPSREPTPASPAGKIDEAGRSPGPERRAAPRADPKPSGPEPSERAGDASPGATPDRDDEEAEARRKRRRAILAARARDRGR
jgi:hypothetical protein